MRYVAIAFFALAALRCEAGDFTGSALEVTGKRGSTDRHIWEQVDRVVSVVAREHHLSPGPTNPNRPDYLLSEKMYYAYYPTRNGTNIDVTYRRQLYRPIEIEILEIGVRRPSRSHRALLRDFRSGLSKSGLLVKRGQTQQVATD